MTRKKFKKVKYGTEFYINNERVVLYQIRALVDIPRHHVKKGDLGGFVESERNLSHKGKAWIGNEAKVFRDSVVSGDAFVGGTAVVAKSDVKGKVEVYDSAIIRNSTIKGTFYVQGKVEIDSSTLDLRNSEIYGTEYSDMLNQVFLKDKGLLVDDYGICVQPRSFQREIQMDWWRRSFYPNFIIARKRA